MAQQTPFSSAKPDKAMTPEQFTQIVEAILAGKYSWACVLILRFTGYNPLHYIPYRTYNRLVKENMQMRKHPHCKTKMTDCGDIESENQPANITYLNQVPDLAYLEVIHELPKTIQGGYFQKWITNQRENFNLIRSRLFSH